MSARFENSKARRHGKESDVMLRIIREQLEAAPALAILARRADEDKFDWKCDRTKLYVQYEVPHETRRQIETAIIRTSNLPPDLEKACIELNLRTSGGDEKKRVRESGAVTRDDAVKFNKTKPNKISFNMIT